MSFYKLPDFSGYAKDCMKYQNLVFLPASDALRADLYKLGLDFLLVRLEGQLQFMVITNQLRLATDLAKRYDVYEFYISDSRRQVIKMQAQYPTDSFLSNKPDKLGKLSRDAQKGNAFLIVTEGNATYHYSVE